MRTRLIAFAMAALLGAAGTAGTALAADAGHAGAAEHQQDFAAMDADRDGALNPEEFAKASPHAGKDDFTAADADKNGNVSEAEWHDWMQKHGGSHGQ